MEVITPAMYAAQTENILMHIEKHINEAKNLCKRIADGGAGFEQRLKDSQRLIDEMRIIRNDATRALIFLDPNEEVK